ncbi:hypothetical protein M2G67_09930, partial [Vibrio vulnificus]|nr:hypothetical protein [Vibrio vulnificus]
DVYKRQLFNRLTVFLANVITKTANNSQKSINIKSAYKFSVLITFNDTQPSADEKTSTATLTKCTNQPITQCLT